MNPSHPTSSFSLVIWQTGAQLWPTTLALVYGKSIKLVTGSLNTCWALGSYIGCLIQLRLYPNDRYKKKWYALEDPKVELYQLWPPTGLLWWCLVTCFLFRAVQQEKMTTLLTDKLLYKLHCNGFNRGRLSGHKIIFLSVIMVHLNLRSKY